MPIQPSHERVEEIPRQPASETTDDPIDPSGGIGDLGEESGTAPWQPEWGTRALAPSAGEKL